MPRVSLSAAASLLPHHLATHLMPIHELGGEQRARSARAAPGAHAPYAPASTAEGCVSRKPVTEICEGAISCEVISCEPVGDWISCEWP